MRNSLNTSLWVVEIASGCTTFSDVSILMDLETIGFYVLVSSKYVKPFKRYGYLCNVIWALLDGT